jgi:hypothetical protein
MRAGVASALVCAMLTGSPAARAEFAFSWTAPEACPTESSVQAAMLEDLKDPPDVRVWVVVEHEETWRARIWMEDGSGTGERRFDGTSCKAVADAATVFLSLWLARSPGGASRARDAQVEPPAALDRAPVAEGPRAARAPAPPDPRLALTMSMLVDAVALPSPAGGIDAAFAWRGDRLRLEASGGFTFVQSEALPSGAGARLYAMIAGARACWTVVRQPIELSPCAGADVYVVAADGFGADRNYETDTASLAVNAGASMAREIVRWLAVLAQVDAVAPTVRHPYFIEGAGALYQPRVLGVRGAFGVEVRFF